MQFGNTLLVPQTLIVWGSCRLLTEDLLALTSRILKLRVGQTLCRSPPQPPPLLLLQFGTFAALARSHDEESRQMLALFRGSDAQFKSLLLFIAHNRTIWISNRLTATGSVHHLTAHATKAWSSNLRWPMLCLKKYVKSQTACERHSNPCRVL